MEMKNMDMFGLIGVILIFAGGFMGYAIGEYWIYYGSFVGFLSSLLLITYGWHLDQKKIRKEFLEGN